MTPLPESQLLKDGVDADGQIKIVATGNSPEVFAEIYDSAINMAIWQRHITPGVAEAAAEFVASRQKPYLSAIMTPNEAPSLLRKEMGGSSFDELADDVSVLVDMFCCLFDLDQVGLRMTVLRDPMCPKFHVDHVPCRLITTYTGVATQWLPHHLVRRDKLGQGSQGKPDHESGLYRCESDIQSMACADVALLKGEGWQGNQNAGLVHRSPAIKSGESRLLVTLDFCS